VLIITTGGTIASRRDPVSGAVSTVATGEELLAVVPEVQEIADLEVENFASVNGWNMSPAMMFDLSETVNERLERPNVDGIVVTHGTDTVEETAFLVDLRLRSDKPVSFAVALRNNSELSPDGPRNLADAISIAASAHSRGYGAMVVANQTAHSAKFVTKTHTTNPDAFESPDYGPVGLMTDDGIRFLRPPAAPTPIESDRIEPEVFLYKATAGADARPLLWAIDSGFKGVVIEGSGAGNVPAAVLSGIEAAISAGIPVVLSSRVLRGFLSPTYGSGTAAGGGWDLARLGVIPATHLPSQKARIKLMLALGATSDNGKIRTWFVEA
jgi:L-asparaginase